MQEVGLSLDLNDCTKCKLRVMKIASSVEGVNSISLDMKEKKLTLIGDMNPVLVVAKLRKVYYVMIVSVGPANEPEKRNEGPRKLEAPSRIVYVERSERRIRTVNNNTFQCGPCLCGMVQVLDCYP